MSGRMIYVSDEAPKYHVQMFEEYPDMHSIKLAAKALGVSEPTVRRKIHTGEIRSVKIGRRVLISKQALLEYVGETAS